MVGDREGAFRFPHPRAAGTLAACALALLALAAGGCSDLGTPLKPMPQSQLSALSLEFGTLAVSQSSTRSVVVSNSGTGKLVGTASVSCGAYAIESGGGAFSIAPGAWRTIVVRFTPDAVGTFPCALDLGPNCPSVSLAGAGALQNPGARCIVLPDTLSFGPVHVGQSKVASFDVLSAGTAPLLVNVVSGCGDYQIISGGGNALIPVGGSVTVVISFGPSAGGTSSCVVSVGPACPDVGVAGSGYSISYVADIKPIFNLRCSDCHFDFAPDEPGVDTYFWLVTVWGGQSPARIVPFDLDNSIIYQRITNTGRFGSLMPYGGPPLPAGEIDKIRQWILEGALDN